MPNLATLKLIGYGAGVLAIIALLAMVNGWRVERDRLREWRTQVVAAARDASGSPKLAEKNVPAQIRLLGQSIAGLKDAVAKQNAAVAALGAESERRKAEASRAAKAAEKRADSAASTSARLSASARAGDRSKKPCEPSKELQNAWR